MKTRLVIMVKEPRPGRVKTRLGRDLGYVRAANWYRTQTLRTLRKLKDPRWDITLAVSPDAAALRSTCWPQGIERVPQGRGDLGARMLRQFRISPPTRTCIIGSDIPGIEKSHIRSAFQKLGECDAVIGPADDGGYWLVGLKQPSTAPFGFMTQVQWSTKHAMDDTRASAKSLKWAELETLSDIDTIEDFHRLHTQSR